MLCIHFKPLRGGPVSVLSYKLSHQYLYYYLHLKHCLKGWSSSSNSICCWHWPFFHCLGHTAVWLPLYKDCQAEEELLPVAPSASGTNDTGCAFLYGIYDDDNKKAVFLDTDVACWLGMRKAYCFQTSAQELNRFSVSCCFGILLADILQQCYCHNLIANCKPELTKPNV